LKEALQAGPLGAKNFDDYIGRHPFLEKEDRKGQTPLTRLRLILLELERPKVTSLEYREAARSGRPARSVTRQPGKEDFEGEPRERTRSVIDPETGDRFFIVRDYNDAQYILPGTRAVHLNRQKAINNKTLREVIDRCGETLMVIQVPPSLFKAYLLKGQRLGKLAQQIVDKGIELREGRIRDAAVYDGGRLQRDPDFLTKESAFRQILGNKKLRGIYEKMGELEFSEATVTDMYFNTGMLMAGKIPPRVALWQIAEKLDLPINIVQRRLKTVLHWIGTKLSIEEAKSYDPVVAARAGKLETRVVRLSEAQTNQKKWQKLRESLKIESTFPPEALPSARWEIWRLITKALQDSKFRKRLEKYIKGDRYNELRWKAICYYYQIGDDYRSDKALTYYDISRLTNGTVIENIRNRINRALSDLGLLDEA